MLNRAQAPEYRPISGFELIRPRHIAFDNGLNVFVFDAGEQEVVRIEWIFGNTFTGEEWPLPNTCVSGMLLEGTEVYNSEQIAETVDYYGAFLVPEYSYDQSTLTLFSLNKHLDHLLPLVKEVLTSSVFPEEELVTYIRNNQQKLQVSLKQNSFVARRSFNHAIFGGNRYGNTPDASDYDRLTRQLLLDVYWKQYVPSNCTLIVSGKVADETLTAIEQLFGKDWRGDPSTVADTIPVFNQVDGKLIVEERKDALQSAIRLGYRSVQRTHPDFPGFQVLNTLLGGYFGSRLMVNIREDKGYTYGIGSGLASLKHAAFFTISSEVGVDVTADTLVEIAKEIHLLKTEPVGDAELALVKNYMMGAMLGSLENVFSHADKFKNAYFSGLDLTYYDYYTDVVKHIDADEILRLANTYLDYDQMVKVVVGKLGTY